MASSSSISGVDLNAKYPYSTLKGPHSFRLLRFVPATQRSTHISCTMQEFDRDSVECPSYTALSYAWGNASIKQQIILDGVPVLVTENLHEALVHLREVFPDTAIWIDALCIDQDNLRERGHQVAQMKDIYSDAKDVISWLGPTSEEVRPFSNWIRSLHRTGEVEARPNPQDDHEEFRAYQSLMKRPYWGRIWTVQEMAVATDPLFMCGKDTVRCDTFTSLVFDRKDETGEGWGSAIAIFWPLVDLRQWRTRRTDLAQAYRWTIYKDATEPRDKLYAILGLIKEGAGKEVQPDYTISPCAVYSKALHAVNIDCLTSNPSTPTNKIRAKFVRHVIDGLAKQCERCPESFLLYEKLLQHCPDLKSLAVENLPRTVCEGCDLSGIFEEACISLGSGTYTGVLSN